MAELSEAQVNKTLQQLARKMGQRNASALLSALGRDKQFMNAIETSVGQEILKGITDRMEQIVWLMIDEKSGTKEAAELRVLRDLLKDWQNIINRYYKNKEKFTESVV